MKTLLSLLLLAAAPAGARTWQRVAYDNAGVHGQQSHLVENTGNWRFTNPGTDDEALRTCVFGEHVEFGYAGLNPKASYRARLRFFSDGPREVRVTADNDLLLTVVKLAAGKAVEREVNLPSATNLRLAFESISGPNAVVSEVEILSTDPKPLTALLAGDVKRWLSARPRYTARPAGIVSLNGRWLFCTNGLSGTNWQPIDVPGEWVMQGFTVKPNTAAGYRRTFTVPASFAGQHVILRFDGVYSEAKVLLNGRELGRHLGGFTPFEFDITDSLQPGKNTLALAVKNESLADTMASGTRYAEHPLGGIVRKVTLFAVPAVHIAGLEVTATPDTTLTRGTAQLAFQIVNAGKSLAHNVGVKAQLTPSGASASTTVESIAAGTKQGVALEVPVENPRLWDTEHPNLYWLTVTLSSGETIRQRIGFKRVEIRGNQLYVNDRPVKLRGACRHETHPTRGRSLTPQLWRRDAELYREANFNLIRTSHYPPAEEFIADCDALGLFVECEAPLCWSGTNANYILSTTLEMVETYRNHPSVLYWSLANESHWCPAYRLSEQVVRALDPARPRTFEGADDHGFCSIAAPHYPGPGGPDRFRHAGRPTEFGEFCHLNCYNRFELSADPGLRDAWGRGFHKMWDAMFTSQGTLGGTLWAAMDDTFFLPDGHAVGYGQWGLLDNWRRPKPEYWHVKKAYSPVRIDETHHHLPVTTPVELAVLNQSDFANLREFDIRWSIDKEHGKLSANIPPHGKGILLFSPKRPPRSGDVLKIVVGDPRGFVADAYAFTFGRKKLPPPAQVTGPATVLENDDQIILSSGQERFTVSRTDGMMRGTVKGPTLMVLPLNDGGGQQMHGRYYYPAFNPTSTNWRVSSIEVKGDSVIVTGEYREAQGTFTYTPTGNGELQVIYRFRLRQKANPRQIGLVFDLPRSFDTISWQRKAPYTVYPPDHIARPAGTARAFGQYRRYHPVDLRERPTWPWSEDATAGGTRDFRSTKQNILWYRIADSTGHRVKVLSNGKQHARAWVEGDQVRVLVADYSNAGDEHFFRRHAAREDRPLRAGARISGKVRLTVR